MNININSSFINIQEENLRNKIKELTNYYLDESLKGNKVAFYYEDIKTNTKISFNQEICFYAASSIKMLVCLIIFENFQQNKININEKILIKNSDLKQGSGIIKNQQQDTEYSILELIKLCLTESDNTAYQKLVELIGKENISKYGKSLGATHTMEGKETDSFGIINCTDMAIYWKKIKDFIDNQEYGKIFLEYLTSPTVKLIKDSNIENKTFVRKYGSWDIAYHEAGYVLDESPYYLIILTQINKLEYKEEFINKTAKMLSEIHNIIKSKNI